MPSEEEVPDAFCCACRLQRGTGMHMPSSTLPALLNIDSTADKESGGVIKSANIILGYPSMQ